MSKLRLRTRTPQEVRRTISRVLNMVANGEIDSKRANSIIYGCNVVLASLRTDDYEKKVQELADLLEEVTRQYEEN